MATKPKPKPKPANGEAQETERKDNRYVRAFSILARDNSLSVDVIAKEAGMKERAARSMVEAWNAAVHALDAHAALSVDPTTLLHAQADTQTGFTRVVRILATEGDLDVAELAKRANVSEGTAKRASQVYHDVLAAQRELPAKA